MGTKLVSCIIVTGCGTPPVVPVFLGIRLVAYGHLVSLFLLPRIINNPSSSHQPTHPHAVLLSPVKSSVSSRREVRTVNASLWTTSDDDSRRYQHAVTGTSDQAGHSHAPNERGQSVPRQYSAHDIFTRLPIERFKLDKPSGLSKARAVLNWIKETRERRPEVGIKCSAFACELSHVLCNRTISREEINSLAAAALQPASLPCNIHTKAGVTVDAATTMSPAQYHHPTTTAPRRCRHCYTRGRRNKTDMSRRGNQALRKNRLGEAGAIAGEGGKLSG